MKVTDIAIMAKSEEAAMTRCRELFGDELHYSFLSTEDVREWVQTGGNLVALVKETQ